MRLIDSFTTRDGSWEPSNLPYSITPAAAALYGREEIPGKGGANHIFVKARPGDPVRFETSDGQNSTVLTVPESGWVNFPLFHSSAYAPARGEAGPWIVYVMGVEVARGIGLPDGLHVSTYLITGDAAQEPVPQPQPPGPITAREALGYARYYLDMAERLL